MIQAINSTNFQGRFGRYSSHTPKIRPYKEFEFMPELQDKNFVKEIFKNVEKKCNDLVCSIKSKLDVLRDNLEGRINNLFYGNK